MLPEISQALSVLLLARNDTGCGAHCLTVLNLASQSCANAPTRGASLSFKGHSKWPELVAVFWKDLVGIALCYLKWLANLVPVSPEGEERKLGDVLLQPSSTAQKLQPLQGRVGCAKTVQWYKAITNTQHISVNKINLKCRFPVALRGGCA